MRTYTVLTLTCMLVAGVWCSGSAPTDTHVSLATYLGDGTSSGINTGLGTAVDKSGNVYVAGAGPFNFGLHPSGDASKNGYILQLSGSNYHPQKIYRVGSQVTALVTRDSSSGTLILAQSDLGISILDGNFHQKFMIEANCGVTDCIADLGRDGTVAVLKRKEHKLEVFDAKGALTASKNVNHKHHQQEIAVDATNKRIYLGLFFQSFPHHVPVQVPCIVAYDYSLAHELWVDYCVSAEEDYQTQNMADSRVNHLYFSDVDNKLYFAGYTDGGNSIFRYNPLDIANNHKSLHGLNQLDSSAKPTYDKYVNTYGFHGAHSLSFIGKINPKDGALEKGQFYLARLTNGQGNSVSTYDVAAGHGGVVVASQSAVASIEHRDTQTVNGQQTAPYGGLDGVLLVVSPDFNKRLVWTQFHKTKGHSSGVSVAANSVHGKTRVAFIAKSKDAELLTVNPISGTGHAATTSTDQYLLVVLDI